MADVFISYSREDQHRARAVADALGAEGVSVWWDSKIRVGDSYDEVTEERLRNAGAVVVLWSKRSAASKWVRAEATVGERCSTLVPAMIEECDRPLRFELVQTADLTRWHGDSRDANWREFVHDVKTAIGHHTTTGEGSSPTAHHAEHGASVAGAHDITIENTFWTSIKDGTDRSDFEAYLKRYPNGHFSDLARNRLAGLERAAIASKPAPQPATAKASMPQPSQIEQTRPTTTVRQTTSQQNSDSVSQQQKGRSVLLFAAVVVIGAIAFSGAAFFVLKQQESVPEQAVASVEQYSQPSLQNNAPEAESSETRPINEDAEFNANGLGSSDSEASGNDIEQSVSFDTPDITSEEKSEPEETDGTFTDCDVCPQMMHLPGGDYTMGSPEEEPGRFAYEGPQREVTISPFAIAMHEITFDQWAACVEDGGCRGYEPSDAGYGRASRPAIYISWRDAKSYVEWLSRRTGRSYRLPTEAEWEYAARAGAGDAYWWGPRFERKMVPAGGPAEVGSYEANAFGLFDMLGNASEWVEDCYVNNYSAAPTDGSPVTNGDCGRRVVRGGSFQSDANDMRVANRRRISIETRDRILGFRVAADID